MGIVRLMTRRGTTGCEIILSLMKNVRFATEGTCHSTRSNFKTSFACSAFLGLALLLSSFSVRAANLLVNPGFEANNGHAVPIGWTRFAPPTAQSFGNYWVEQSNATVSAHSGLFYFKEWGASYNTTNNVAGLYQDFSGAPGSVFNANGWFYI